MKKIIILPFVVSVVVMWNVFTILTSDSSEMGIINNNSVNAIDKNCNWVNSSKVCTYQKENTVCYVVFNGSKPEGISCVKE